MKDTKKEFYSYIDEMTFVYSVKDKINRVITYANTTYAPKLHNDEKANMNSILLSLYSIIIRDEFRRLKANLTPFLCFLLINAQVIFQFLQQCGLVC